MSIIKEFLEKKNHFSFLNEGIAIRTENGELARVYSVYLHENVPYVEYDRLSGGKFVHRPVSQLPIAAAERIADIMEWKLKRY